MSIFEKCGAYKGSQYTCRFSAIFKFTRETRFATFLLSCIPSPFLTHLCRVDFSTLTLWTGSFSLYGVSFYYFHVLLKYLNANSVDPEQTPRSATSDLDLHCLPMSNL